MRLTIRDLYRRASYPLEGEPSVLEGYLVHMHPALALEVDPHEGIEALVEYINQSLQGVQIDIEAFDGMAKAQTPPTFPKLNVTQQDPNVDRVSTGRNLDMKVRLMTHLRNNDGWSRQQSDYQEEVAGKLADANSKDHRGAFAAIHTPGWTMGMDYGFQKVPPQDARIGYVKAGPLAFDMGTVEGTFQHERFHAQMAQVGVQHGSAAQVRLAQHLYAAIPEQLKPHLDAFFRHSTGENHIGSPMEHEERLARIFNYVNSAADRNRFHGSSFYDDDHRYVVDTAHKRAIQALNAIAPLVDQAWMYHEPPWKQSATVMAHVAKTRAQAAMKKTRPAPKFPGLGVPDDRRETETLSTFRQRDMAARLLANSNVRAGTHHVQPAPGVPLDEAKQAFHHDFAHNPEVRAKTVGQYHEFLTDGGTMGLSDSSRPANPRSFAVGIDLRRRGNNPESQPGADWGTALHEGLHDIFSRVEAQFGTKARRNLAQNLFEHLKLHHPAEFTSMRDFVHDRYPGVWTTHVPEEEHFATMLNYLNHAPERTMWHARRGHADAVAWQYDTDMKRLHRTLIDVAKRADKTWVLSPKDRRELEWKSIEAGLAKNTRKMPALDLLKPLGLKKAPATFDPHPAWAEDMNDWGPPDDMPYYGATKLGDGLYAHKFAWNAVSSADSRYHKYYLTGDERKPDDITYATLGGAPENADTDCPCGLKKPHFEAVTWAVHPNHQGKGLGRLLLAHVVGEHGHLKAGGTGDPDNTVSRRAHRAFEALAADPRFHVKLGRLGDPKDAHEIKVARPKRMKKAERFHPTTLIQQKLAEMAQTGQQVNSGNCDEISTHVCQHLKNAQEQVTEEHLPAPHNETMPGHYWVKWRDRYYDAEAPQGVSHPLHLPIFQRASMKKTDDPLKGATITGPEDYPSNKAFVADTLRRMRHPRPKMDLADARAQAGLPMFAPGDAVRHPHAGEAWGALGQQMNEVRGVVQHHLGIDPEHGFHRYQVLFWDPNGQTHSKVVFQQHIIPTEDVTKKSEPPKDEGSYLPMRDWHKQAAAPYFDEQGTQTASSRETPYTGAIPPVGTWGIDHLHLLYGREIEQLREVDPNTLHPTEVTGHERMADVDRYAGWMKEGKVAPPINVVETDRGTFNITDGHRRWLAAKKAGQQKLLAWVSPTAPHPEGKIDSEGRPMRVGLTHELANGLPYKKSEGWTERINQAPKSRAGYALFHHANPGKNEWTVEAYHPQHPHVKVGEYTFGATHRTPNDGEDPNHLIQDGLKGWNVEVHPDHRRQGLATDMRLHAEKVFGMKISPGDFQTPDGAGFLGSIKKGELQERAAAKPWPSVFRGMSPEEWQYTQDKGHILSDQRWCVPGEGTCFTHNHEDAAGYTNFGRTDPAKTGKPNFVVEVESGPDTPVDRRDGYPKATQPISIHRIRSVTQYHPDGHVEKLPWPAQGGLAKSVIHDDPVKPMMVWRVEHHQHRGGPHESGDFYADDDDTRPSPNMDFDAHELREGGIGTGSKGSALFGFEKPEHAENWFGPEGMQDLTKRGYVLRQVPAKKVWRSQSESQVMFLPHDGLQKAEYPTSWPEGSLNLNHKLWWHGTPSGDLRGGPNGLHIGSRLAAEQALHARIGIPAEGTWDGTREYGKTLLAGRRTLIARGILTESGYNMGLPEEDHYPSQRTTFGDGTPVLGHHKPDIFPCHIVGPMTNSIYTPHEDFKANGYMAAQIKRGTAKRGFFYRNVGEDEGSISAVVPNGEHLSRVALNQKMKKTERNLADAPARSVVEDMHGYQTHLRSSFGAARYLTGGIREPSFDVMRRALWDHDGDMESAALQAYGLPTDDHHRKALRHVARFQGLQKALQPAIPTAYPLTPASKAAADLVNEAAAEDQVDQVKLNGKHSEGSYLARGDDQTLLLKPGANGPGPAAGAQEEQASQSAREAAFWRVSAAWGLGESIPRADLIKIDGRPFAAIKMLDHDWKNAATVQTNDPARVQDALHRYRESGMLHKWAILDFVCGNPDRHGQNVMIGPKGELRLIDHGSAFAGDHFDPAFDESSFVPWYLRAKVQQEKFNKMTVEDRLRHMPRLHPDTERELRAWVNKLEMGATADVLQEFGINSGPTLTRLAKVKEISGPVDLAVNRLWVTI